jgi:hypothetical protein
MIIEPFPLQWPQGYPVTYDREYSKFKCTLAEARDGVLYELSRLKATDIVITSNVQVDRRGLIPASGRLVYDNPGVAVYFKYSNQESIVACDNWKYLHENMRAVQNSLEAIRSLERWRCTNIISQALSERKELPQNAGESHPAWWQVLGVDQSASTTMIKSAYHAKAKVLHPDNKHTGSKEKFLDLSRAFEEAIKAKG